MRNVEFWLNGDAIFRIHPGIDPYDYDDDSDVCFYRMGEYNFNAWLSKSVSYVNVRDEIVNLANGFVWGQVVRWV